MVTEMKSIKKKILVGLLSGALVFAGGIGTYKAFAAEKPDSDEIPQMREIEQMRQHATRPHQMKEMSESQIAEFSKKIAEHYGVSESEVAQACKNRTNPHDIQAAAMLAKLSGKSFASVFEMKCDWWQVSKKLGITEDQIRAFFEQESADRLSEVSSLDSKIVNDLLKEGYNPRDIVIAGKIAKESGKNVKNILAKKKINNTWSDVAKEFGVDIKNIMPKHHKDSNDQNFHNRQFGRNNNK